MFRIGEFSNLVRVSARMLRHYEKQGLLSPAAIDRESGYRQYSADQIPLLMRITAFRDMGFSIEETRELLDHFEDADHMRCALALKRQGIQADIAKQQHRLSLLKKFIRGLSEEEQSMIQDVCLKELPKVTVLSLREVIPAYDQEGQLWHKLGSFIAQKGIACSNERGGFSIYLDEEYKESDVAVEVAVPVSELGESEGTFVYKELEAIPLAATIRFSGPYENYTPAMEKLGQWMEQNGYAFAGCIRGEALVSPQDQTKAEHYLTELQVPVRKI